MATGKSALPPNQWAQKKFFEDPTPNGLINQRIIAHTMLVLAKPAGLDVHPDGDFYLKLLQLVGRKMCSVWQHMDRFKQEQDRLVAEFMQMPVREPYASYVDCSQALYLEFDEFLVQIKSTLDHLVKMPIALLGKSWNLRTFGSKGEDVLKALRNNVPAKHAETAKRLEERLFCPAHRQWLEIVIASRDEMNHYISNGMPVEEFGVFRDAQGVVHVPMATQTQTLADAMVQVWAMFLYFVEDFIAIFTSMRFAENYVLREKPRDPTSVKSPWEVIDLRFLEVIEALKRQGVSIPD